MIIVHPGAVVAPMPGSRWCTEDVDGDGRAHIPLISAEERHGMLRASERAGWWIGYATVSWVSWWSQGQIFWQPEGIVEPGTKALVATFAEFPVKHADFYVEQLTRIRQRVAAATRITPPHPGTATPRGHG